MTLLTFVLSLLLVPLSSTAAKPLVSPLPAGAPAVPSPTFYLPGKGSVKYQDAGYGGTASVLGSTIYRTGYSFGSTSYKSVGPAFPNAVVTVGIESELPLLKANGINMVFARFPRRPGETKEQQRPRIVSYMNKARSLGMKVVFGAEWYFVTYMQVRTPATVTSARNTSSSLRAGNYDFLYTYSRRMPNGTIAETSTWLLRGQKITLPNSSGGKALRQIQVRSPNDYVNPDGSFVSTLAGWNLYAKAPNGYYVRQNTSPVRTRSITLKSLRTDGCNPGSRVYTRCLPPYNNTFSVDAERIRMTTSWINGYSNLAGYWFIDEPSSMGSSVPAMRKAYSVWRRYTKKPLVVNFAEVLGKFGNDFPTGDGVRNNPYGTGICDICIMEMYPRQQLGPYVITKQTDGMRKFLSIIRSKHGSTRLPTIWTMPGGHTTDSPAQFTYLKRLTYGETYRQVNDNIRYGATGIVWYVWDKRVRTPSGAFVGGGLRHNPAALKAVKDFGTRVKRGSVILNRYSSTLHLHDGSRLRAPAANHISPTAGTVSFWTSPEWHATDNRSHVMFAWAGSGTNSRLALEKTSDNRLVATFRSSSGATTVVSRSAFTKVIPAREPSFYDPTAYPQTLYHVALTWGGGYLKVYLNGQLVGSSSLSRSLGTGAPYFYFGANYDGSRAAGGNYAEMAVYPTPLTPAQLEIVRGASPAGGTGQFSIGIAKPAADQRLAGTVRVYPRANPDPSIRAMRLYVDGRLVASSTAFPYVISWNTNSVSNGYHNLQLRYLRNDGVEVGSQLRRVRMVD